jgi:hypothetical protein
MKMEISFSDRSIILMAGGLAFIFFSFVNVDGYQNRISLNVSEGSKKYLRLFGIILIIIGLFLPPNDSDHQNNEVPVTINNNLTQIATSEQKERMSIETLAQKLTPVIKTKYLSNDANFYSNLKE